MIRINNYFKETSLKVFLPKTMREKWLLIAALGADLLTGGVWASSGYLFAKFVTNLKTEEPVQEPVVVEEEPPIPSAPPPSPELPVIDQDLAPPLPLVRAYNPETDSVGTEHFQHPVRLGCAPNSCFLAAIFQFLLQTPDFEKRLERRTDRAASILSHFIEVANEARKTGAIVSAAEMQKLREVLHLISPGRFQRNSRIQEDAPEALEAILDFFSFEKTKMQFVKHLQSDQPLFVEGSITCNQKGEYLSISPPDPVPFVRIDLPKDLAEKGALLNALIQKSFWKQGESEPFRCRDFDGAPIQVDIATERVQFLEPPKQLILQLKRFNSQLQKIEGPVHMQEILELPEAYFANGEEARYRLDVVLCHLGTARSGHYVTALRSPDGYFFANNSPIQLEPITAQEFQHCATFGYLLIFRRIDIPN